MREWRQNDWTECLLVITDVILLVERVEFSSSFVVLMCYNLNHDIDFHSKPLTESLRLGIKTNTFFNESLQLLQTLLWSWNNTCVSQTMAVKRWQNEFGNVVWRVNGLDNDFLCVCHMLIGLFYFSQHVHLPLKVQWSEFPFSVIFHSELCGLRVDRSTAIEPQKYLQYVC